MEQVIRVAKESDAEAIAEIYCPLVESSPITFEVAVPGLEDFKSRIREIGDRFPWLICEVNQQVVGYAYGSPYRAREAYRWSAEASIYVGREFQRKGIASALYQKLFSALAIQGYRNVYAGITLPNTASVYLHRSIGFEEIGVFKKAGYKLGAWHDVSWWQLKLREHDPSPADPVPFRV